MSYWKTGVLAVVAVLGISLLSTQAHEPKDYQKHAESLRKITKLLNESYVLTEPFPTKVPLEQFLATLEKQFSKEIKITFRIDKEAFGTDYAKVAATPIRLPPFPQKVSLAVGLRMALTNISPKAVVDLGPYEVIVTTPERTVFSAVHDIGGIVPKANSALLADFALPQAKEEGPRIRTQKMARVIQAIGSFLDGKETIEVLNGTRLVVRARAATQAEIASVLDSHRRNADVAVMVTAKLYEVDQAFHARVKNAKRLSQAELDEEEERFLVGQPFKSGDLFKPLEKQCPLLTNDKIKIPNGRQAAILSRHQAVMCRFGPAQLRVGVPGRQTVLEGVTFLAETHITADRRSVRMNLTEQATTLKQIDKASLRPVDNEGKELHGEIPIIDEAAHTQQCLIPDGGSLLTAVHYRPRSLQATDRRWVLAITARIYIAEEERLRRQGVNHSRP